MGIGERATERVAAVAARSERVVWDLSLVRYLAALDFGRDALRAPRAPGGLS